MSTRNEAVAVVIDEGLYRGLNRAHALAIVVGAVIGASIYIRPAYIAQLVATPAQLMAVWIVAGLFCLAGALTYGELGARVPRSGGEYAFLRVTLGELPAFLYGWMRLTVGLGGMASMAIAASSFLADVVPLGGGSFQLAWPGAHAGVAVDLGPTQGAAVVILGTLAALNIRGVGTAGRFQATITAIKVFALLVLVAALLMFGQSQTATTREAVDRIGPSQEAFAYSAAILAGVSAYNGWAHVTMLGGELQEPRRTLRWALVAGMSLAIALYVVANLAYLHVLSMHELSTAFSTRYPNAPSVASRAAEVALGVRVGRLLPLLFLISTVGALHCSLLALPRMVFAMARDGLLPQRLGKLAVRSRAPVFAIVSLTALASILVLFGTYDRLANMMAFACLLFFAVNAYGLLRVQRVAQPLGVRASFGTSAIPGLFLVSATLLLATLVARGSVEVLVAVALIALGVPVFYATRPLRTARA